MKNYQDLALALAGVCQAVALVSQLAEKGSVADDNAHLTTIQSLFITQPESTLAVFGGDLNHLRLGLSTLIAQLTSAERRHVFSYWASLLNLEAKLQRNAKAKQQLTQRIARLPEQRAFHEPLDATMQSILADIYVETLSPIGRKIQVIGSAFYLQQSHIQDQIRACLLAGVRAAVLWRQVGGSMWTLLFSRKRLIQAAKQLYSQLN